MIRPLRVLAILGATLVGVGCTGAIGGSSGSEPGGGAPGSVGGGTMTGAPGSGATGANAGAPKNPMAGSLDDSMATPGPSPLRRMTVLEYRNTVRDLLGMDASSVSTAGFAADVDSADSGFFRGAKFSTGDDAHVFLKSTDSLAQAVMGKLQGLLPCSPIPAAAADQDACAQKFITQFGLRAFRRPLSPAEVTRLVTLYKAQRSPDIGSSFEDSIASLVGAMLQTPYFLYHWELGPNAPIKDGNAIRFNPYEMASRLSYMLWATMPDQKLFDAAGAGGLVSPEQIATEARRMLADPKARDAIKDFHYQWLEIIGLADMPKDPSFTNYSPAVAQAMNTETEQFVYSVFFGPKANGQLKTLLTSNTSFIDQNLAKVYGATTFSGTGTTEFALDPTQRAGILTEGSFLATKADSGDTLPPRRGDAILHRALCIELKIPDKLDVPMVADPNPKQTTRQRFEVHGQAACAQGCHNLIDPVGFAFENYDAIGGYRTTENGQPVDASGTLMLPSGPLAFKNAIDFVNGLAGKEETADCMAKQWLRYGLRRHDLPTDDASVKALQQTLKSSNGDLRELIVAVTKSRVFTHRTLSAGEVAQ